MVVIEGHRICGRLAPENSRQAVHEARRLGVVQSVEFDVRGTSDGAVVVFHGPEFSGHERIGQYAALDLLENGENVPLYTEIFGLCVEHGLAMNVEIKENDDRVIAAVVREAEVASLARGLVRVSSFEREILEKVRRRAPELPLGLLVNDSRKYDADGEPLWEAIPEDFAEFHGNLGSRGVKGDSVNFCAAVVTEKGVRECQAAGLDAMVWFPGDKASRVSDEKEVNLAKIVDLQPDVICTNRPDVLGRLLIRSHGLLLN